MRSFFILSFVICHFFTFSQKVTLTPLSFKKDFTLEKISATNVLKDYTQFSESPFTKIPKGFTLSNPSVFYKFDTLNCSLYIKKREDVDSLIYYRDCEDGRWCYNMTFQNESKFSNSGKEILKYMFRQKGCCDILSETDTSALLLKNDWVDFHSYLNLDGNLPASLISENYVTNAEYGEFIFFVKDSMMRYDLANTFPKEFALPRNTEDHSPEKINYDKKVDFDEKRFMPLFSNFYFPDHEKYQKKKEWDFRKLNYRGINLKYTINAPEEECSNCNYYLNADICGKGLKKCVHNKPGDFSELLCHTQFFSDRKKPLTNEELFRSTILRNLIHTNIAPDSLIWLQNSNDEKERSYRKWMTENYTVRSSFESLPVCGINFWQAKSFLAWKTYEHNKLLIRDNQKFRVVYTLPLPEEIKANPKITAKLPAVDFDRYLITNKEYEKFVAYVVDSNVLSIKIADVNTNFVRNKLTIKTTDDNGTERPEEEWRHNIKHYNGFYYKEKAEWKKDTLFEYFSHLLVLDHEIDYLNYDGIDTRKLFYCYEWKYLEKDSILKYHYLDLSPDYYQYHHVYGTPDRSYYIIRENINIYPTYNAKMMSRLDEALIYKRLDEIYKTVPSQEYSRIADTLDPISSNSIGTMRFEFDSISGYKHKLYDFQSNPDAPITAITYEQAKAYYHWKNEVPYIPTKEEWNLIRQGINPYEEKELEVPGPFFRYVIRVYPVREED